VRAETLRKEALMETSRSLKEGRKRKEREQAERESRRSSPHAGREQEQVEGIQERKGELQHRKNQSNGVLGRKEGRKEGTKEGKLTASVETPAARHAACLLEQGEIGASYPICLCCIVVFKEKRRFI